MDPRYVKLEDQTSFTGDKKALKFLPKDVQAVAFKATDVAVTGKPSRVVTPSSALTSKEANALAKAKQASGLMSEDLLSLLQKEYITHRVESPALKPEFSGLGADDFLSKVAAGAAGVSAAVDTLQKVTDPEAAKKAAEAKAKEEQMAKIKMVAGVVALGALAYFLFFRGGTKARKRSRRK